MTTRNSDRLIVTTAFLAVVLWGASPSPAQVGSRAGEIVASSWINESRPHGPSMPGKVTLVEFWTFGCFNCQNVEPHIKEWDQRYAERGLVVIGVHSPESDHERDPASVAEYVRGHGIRYAVAIDGDFKTWANFSNHAWPATYLIDRQGIVRYSHIGEGGYDETEQRIQSLLAEK